MSGTAVAGPEDCLGYPVIYELAELLPPPGHVGCPRRYPPLVYLLLASLMPVTGSKRSAVGSLTTATQWTRVRAAVRRHAGRRAAALLAPAPPSRAQYLYAEENILAPHIDILQEAFAHHALQQALAQGLFPAGAARNWGAARAAAGGGRHRSQGPLQGRTGHHRGHRDRVGPQPPRRPGRPGVLRER
ncbi:hypothetical protein [Streptomyces sp. NPDC088256]|uniref:hypothetical protein n=1 Tax=Streptomyces sp. NPDC088256 TaxID=3365848 RepID=UPI003807C46E